VAEVTVRRSSAQTQPEKSTAMTGALGPWADGCTGSESQISKKAICSLGRGQSRTEGGKEVRFSRLFTLC
jgi:invasion protein IalB